MTGARRLVAVIGTTLPSDMAIEREVLARVGAEIVDARELSHEDASELLARVDGVLSEGFFDFDFQAMPRCRGLSLYAIGHDQVSLPAASAAGVLVTNVPDYCVEDVADHAMTLLLAVWRKLPEAGRIAASDDWSVHELRPIRRLADGTLGLIGLGRIAVGVARRAQAFGLRVVAYDAYVEPSAAQALGVELMPLQALLSQSDAISIHVPLTLETSGLVGDAELALLRRGAVLVSTSRGGVVSDEALLRALDRGHLSAGLDVLPTEPPSTPAAHRLATHERVICTPHMAYYSEESLADLRRRAADALAAVLDGKHPPSLLNPDALDRRHLEPTTRPGGM